MFCDYLPNRKHFAKMMSLLIPIQQILKIGILFEFGQLDSRSTLGIKSLLTRIQHSILVQGRIFIFPWLIYHCEKWTSGLSYGGVSSGSANLGLTRIYYVVCHVLMFLNSNSCSIFWQESKEDVIFVFFCNEFLSWHQKPWNIITQTSLYTYMDKPYSIICLIT